MATYSNVSVSSIFASYHSQNCWIYLAGVGWKKVRTGNADGVTNVHLVLTAARANARLVTAITDAGNANIEQVYL